jgi:glycosyltransferase involved in cell wall biosynthesis
MAKTKVLHIITRLDRGGSAENTLLTVIGLDKERYEVALISGPSAEPIDRLMDRAQASGVRLITVKNLVRKISPWRDFKALFALYRLVKGGRYDIVHTHSSKAGILGRWAAHLAGVPHLVHTPHGHVFYGYYNKLVTRLFVLLERLTACFSDKIVALTPQEVKEYLALGIGEPEKFIVIHSGVELACFRGIGAPGPEVRAELNIPRDLPVVGSVGRLEEVKGYRYFIEAASLIIEKIPEVCFLLVGDGSLRARLQRQATDFGLEHRFVFTGWRDDVPRMISAMDIFVLSSLNEGMGKVLVEAMALKKPIVATRVGGVPGLIKDGRNGILVPPEDPSALAAAVIGLLEDKPRAERLGLEAGRGIEWYSAQYMVRKIEGLYEELLGPNDSGGQGPFPNMQINA